MGSQKTATKRKPATSHSGTRKSAKENIEPPSAKQPYPKAHPAYKKAASAEDTGEEASKGEAEAAAALVSMQNRGQTGQPAFERTTDKYSMFLMMRT